jgi:hypothetical protein
VPPQGREALGNSRDLPGTGEGNKDFVGNVLANQFGKIGYFKKEHVEVRDKIIEMSVFE